MCQLWLDHPTINSLPFPFERINSRACAIPATSKCMGLQDGHTRWREMSKLICTLTSTRKPPKIKHRIPMSGYGGINMDNKCNLTEIIQINWSIILSSISLTMCYMILRYLFNVQLAAWTLVKARILMIWSCK